REPALDPDGDGPPLEDERVAGQPHRVLEDDPVRVEVRDLVRLPGEPVPGLALHRDPLDRGLAGRQLLDERLVRPRLELRDQEPDPAVPLAWQPQPRLIDQADLAHEDLYDEVDLA